MTEDHTLEELRELPPAEPAYWWEWVGRLQGMGEPDYRLIDARAEEYRRVIFDCTATWEQQFDAGPGTVCSVSDAARVLAKYVTRPVFDETYTGSPKPSQGGIRCEEPADGSAKPAENRVSSASASEQEG